MYSAVPKMSFSSSEEWMGFSQPSGFLSEPEELKAPAEVLTDTELPLPDATADAPDVESVPRGGRGASGGGAKIGMSAAGGDDVVVAPGGVEGGGADCALV